MSIRRCCSVALRAALPWAVFLGTTLVTLAAAAGVVLYPQYRATLRQPIFAGAPVLGYLFERKEHIAFAAVLLR